MPSTLGKFHVRRGGFLADKNEGEESEELASGEKAAESPIEDQRSGSAPVLEPPPDEGATTAYQQRARLAEDRLAEVLAAYRTLRTDTEAYRERLTRNIERRYEQRRERLLLKFIDILDNLDRALAAAETTAAGEPLIQGLILVRTQLLQTLQDEGLERIAVLGLPFDPTVSEAVDLQPVEEPDQHQLVVKELMRGYRLMGRVARVSRVVVGEHAGAGVDVAPPSPPSGEGDQAAQPGSVTSPNDEAETSHVPEPPASPDAALAPTEDEGPTLEEIIARAEAQEALFPAAFTTENKKD